MPDPAPAPKPPYMPTASEKKLMDEWLEEKGRVPRIMFSIGPDGSFTPSNTHPEQSLGILLIMKALGLNSTAQYSLFLGQTLSMVKADKGEKAMTNEVNEVLSVVIAQKPRDITEAMLCLQMASIHLATTTALATLRNTDHFDVKIDAGNLANKLSRTFTMQVDALKRYRTKGQAQRVVVEHKHINVAPGGQAIIGDVTTGGVGAVSKTGPQSHERARTAPALTLVETIPAPFDLAKEVVEAGSGGDAA